MNSVSATNPLHKTVEQYMEERKTLLETQRKLKLRDLVPTEEELAANEVFKKLVKEAEKTVPEGFHFRPFCHQKEMEETKLYKLFTKMPKASIHHVHADAYLGSDWFVKRTYDDDLWVNEKQGTVQRLKGEPKEEGWVKIVEKRSKAANVEEFNESLKAYFELDTMYWHADLWKDFFRCIDNRTAIQFEWRHAEDYFNECFQIAFEEGYSNLQLKIQHSWFHDEDGKVIPHDEEIAMYKRCIERIQKKDPHFTCGLIFQGLRFWDKVSTKKYLDDCYESKKKYGDLILGFDLVGDEFTRETYSKADILLENVNRQREDGISFPYVFHAGETVIENNTNILDCLLLGVTKRFGHAVNLCKHPYLYEIIKQQDICIECLPTANIALQYMRDLRLHPACTYHNLGLRVSIGTDNPGIDKCNSNWEWFIVGFSFEWDLIEIKRALVDSIECSIMPEKMIPGMKEEFEKRWKAFLKNVEEVYESRV